MVSRTNIPKFTSASNFVDLLIASVLCYDPVMYIDDRWLYDQEDDLRLITRGEEIFTTTIPDWCRSRETAYESLTNFYNVFNGYDCLDQRL